MFTKFLLECPNFVIRLWELEDLYGPDSPLNTISRLTALAGKCKTPAQARWILEMLQDRLASKQCLA